MRSQLMRMWEIQEESNQSHSDSQLLPLTKNTMIQEALLLTKINDEMMNAHSQDQLNLQQYLNIQRANTNINETNQPKKKKLTAQEKQKQREYEQNYGKGFKMLQGMGFNLGKGLGREEQGRTNIVEAEFKTSLTSRNQEYKGPSSDRQEKEEEQEEKEPEDQNIQDIFRFRSKNFEINQFFWSLKNSYESLQTKLSIASRQHQSMQRQISFANDFKLQKENEINEIDKQIKGLEGLTKNFYNAKILPELGLQYGIDLLIVKTTLQKIRSLPFQQFTRQGDDEKSYYNKKIEQYLQAMIESLTEMYLQKEKAKLREYNNVEEIFKNFPKNYASEHKKNIRFETNKKLKECLSLSEGDEKKINKFIRIILEESLINNHLEPLLARYKSIQDCDMWVLDLLEVIHKFDRGHRNKNGYGQLITHLKQRYLIKICNNYLKKSVLISKNLGSNQKTILPHLIIFPWFSLISLEELDMSGFLSKVSSKFWSLHNDQLFQFMAPWLQYLPSSNKNYFICFYLAPRMLYEMENFKIQDSSKTLDFQKNALKHFIMYSKMLPLELREEILKNSIGFHIYQTYNKLRSERGSLQQIKQIKDWVIRWSKKMDKIGEGVVRKLFIEEGVHDIFCQ